MPLDNQGRVVRGEEGEGRGKARSQQHLSSGGDGRGKGDGHIKFDKKNLQQSDVGSDGGDGGDGEVGGDEGGMELVSREHRDQLMARPPSAPPNLLARRPEVGGVVALAPRDTREHRLALMGGVTGFVGQMTKDRVTPDAKTLAMLLALVPNTLEQEQQVLAQLQAHAVAPDTPFFNTLIRARAGRGDHALGRATLAMMFEAGVAPDVQTLGVLAMCARTRHEVREFLEEVDGMNATLNPAIVGALVASLRLGRDPGGARWLLARVEAQGIRPDARLLREVERLHRDFRAEVLRQERGEKVHWGVARDARAGWREWRSFTTFYSGWLERCRPELESDPMVQYQAREGWSSGVTEAVQRRHKARGVGRGQEPGAGAERK